MNWSEINGRKNSTFIVMGVAIVLLGIMVLQFYTSDNSDSYARKVIELRRQKDAQLKRSVESPIKEEDRKSFKGLTYFVPDESYRVKADLERESVADTLVLVTTTGTDYKVIRFGVLEFKLQGLTHKLAAYRYIDTEKKDLFVPFRDLTSGNSTYGGGRYLDIPLGKGDIWIDFNEAYYPYCVYNENFVCPLPPTENKLSVEIMAGEKN